ncbi:MAG TPA: NADH-quinone oxidoreductase subunit L [Rectinemataceae bacterium]|nr:NADH-quinone oxidoreductase subunit L [Rectinemataceae bacterium]
MNETALLGLIPALPLAGFLVTGLFGKRLGRGVSGWLATIATAGSFALALALLLAHPDGFAAGYGEGLDLRLFDWLPVAGLDLSFGLQLDPLALIMTLVVTGVGALIHLYSIGYMHDDEGAPRFFSFMNLFIFSMLILVLADNYAVMFVGWEGVGLCSYLLIGFWFTRDDYNGAAVKAFVMNRIGDLGFLLGLFAMLATFGSLSFGTVFAKASSMASGTPVLTLITVLLFVGAMGKSAQIPLYTWLPDAMAGPTPVSALIHAATMVTAGIYMVIRSHVLYDLAPASLTLIAVVGLATAVWAGLIALTQRDIKKVLAYSTVSQLGYMFLALGVGAYGTGYFHVFTHAFFKALLFLGAGSVIHALSGEQDIRRMGGLRKKLPITYLTFLVGTLAISGIPPFAGFFSKDSILAAAFERSPLLWAVGVFAAFVTAFYMGRLFVLVFHGPSRVKEGVHPHESPATMTLPLVLLAVGSIGSGFLGLPAVFGLPNILGNFLAPSAGAYESSLGAGTEWLLMGISVLVALAGFGLAAWRYGPKAQVPGEDSTVKGLARWSLEKFRIDELYDSLIVKPLFALSNWVFGTANDRGVDGLVRGGAGLFAGLGRLVRRIQTGNTVFYLFAMTLGVIVIAAIAALG